MLGGLQAWPPTLRLNLNIFNLAIKIVANNNNYCIVQKILVRGNLVN